MDRSTLRSISLGFYVLAALLTVIGFMVMFYYGHYDSDLGKGNSFGHVVGGDAYNFIIIGIRGLGFIVSGLTSTVAASVLLHLSIQKGGAEG